MAQIGSQQDPQDQRNEKNQRLDWNYEDHHGKQSEEQGNQSGDDQMDQPLVLQPPDHQEMLLPGCLDFLRPKGSPLLLGFFASF